MSVLEEGTLTGEPDAANPHVRFGGRGGRNKSGLPYPYTLLMKSPGKIATPGCPLQRETQPVEGGMDG
jgi:hypothetical protein